MKILTIALTLLLLVGSTQRSQAFQVRELKPLDFGVFTITDSGAHSIIVATNGITTMPDGGIHRMRSGHNATFQIVGANPSTDFYVTIDPTTITHTSGSPVFDIDTFTFDPPNNSSTLVHPDPSGDISFDIGATLHVPTGAPVTTGTYRGTYNFMINY